MLFEEARISGQLVCLVLIVAHRQGFFLRHRKNLLGHVELDFAIDVDGVSFTQACGTNRAIIRLSLINSLCFLLLTLGRTAATVFW
jgi:hypothetical protein